jgi:hypothetical protein
MVAQRRFAIFVVLATLLWASMSALGFSQENGNGNGDNGNDKEEKEEPLRDNSFLIEEAYNQEQGVVQHIFNLVPAWEHGDGAQRTVDFMFTQEWPIFSQRNQFSYAIPMRRVDGTPDFGTGEDTGGLGDMMVNYRFQLLYGDNKEFPLACAPRASIIFPSGDSVHGLGNGKTGVQLNLPLSYEMEKWAFHFNAGLTKTDGVTAGIDPDQPFIGHTVDGKNLGGSAIYFLQPHFNLMLEAVSFWNDKLEPDGREHTQCQAILLPGFRWSPYTEGDTQWVVGCGVPIGLSAAAPDVGIFFYMSFEHRFLRKRPEDKK